MVTKEVKIGSVSIGGGNPLVLIAGPCVIEDDESTLKTAIILKDISDHLNIPLIFKSSYDKANRSSISSYRGPGLTKGLAVLEKVRKETSLPIISDVHSVEEVDAAAEVLDALQIPALLCRQTDLIIAASRSGKAVNIKKGQFLSPYDMKNAIDKVLSTGNNNLTITERGVSFGYNNLVVDMRSIPIMQGFGFPVIFDATHAVQLPGGRGTSSGGQKEFAAPLARAAVAAGCDAVFLEVHQAPEKALCDGPNMINPDQLSLLAEELSGINKLINKQ